MNDEKTSFKSGDKVRIKSKSDTVQTGAVVNTLTLKTRTGLCELVWVKLVGGKVDGFSPGSLERLRVFGKRQAA